MTNTPSILIDESIALGLCFEDQIDATVLLAVEALHKAPVLVTPFWHGQVAERLRDAEHRRRISFQDAQRFLELLKFLQPLVDEEASSHLWDRTLSIAHEFSINIPTACLLEVAERRHATIATRDRELQRIARKKGLALIG